MTEAEIYQKQVKTCKQVQNMINELYISKDKIRDKIKELEKELNRYYMEGKNIYNLEYATYLRGKINILYDILEEDKPCQN